MSALRFYDSAQPWVDDSNKSHPLHRLTSVKKNGGIGVTVYIVGTPGGMRHADKHDVAAAYNAGLGVLPNWERAADFFRKATLKDCEAAGKEALTAAKSLGFPADGSVAVAFSWDYQVPASGYANALKQLKACGAGLGSAFQAIGYAQIGLIRYWASHGEPGPHWLMGSTWRSSSKFTSAEVNDKSVFMVQSHDASGNWLNTSVAGTDVNTVINADAIPAWWPPNSPYGGQVTEAQMKQLLSAIAAVPHDTWAYDQQGKRSQAWAFLQQAAKDQALSKNIQSLVQSAVEAGIKAAGSTAPSIDDIAAGVERGMKQAFADAGAS